MKPECAMCKFFQPNVRDSSGRSGQCRKNPPVVIQTSVDHGAAGMRFDLETVWPVVAVDEWCGEMTAGK